MGLDIGSTKTQQNRFYITVKYYTDISFFSDKMKKSTILVIGILFMLVISGVTAMGINSIIQSPSEPSRLGSFKDFKDTPGFVIETSKIGPVDFNINNINELPMLYVCPDPGHRIKNYTVNFSANVVLPSTTANVYTDKETYVVGELITYGIENTLNYNIGGVSVSIEKMVTCNWEPVLLTYYMPLLLQPGEVYESTWDQKGGYGIQVETGWYRVAIGYGYYDGVSKHGMEYAYFSIHENNIVYPANVMLDSFEDVFVIHFTRPGDGPIIIHPCNYVSVTFQLKNTGGEVATDVSCFIKCCDQNGMILFAQIFTFDDLDPNGTASDEYRINICEPDEVMYVTHSVDVRWSPQGINTYMKLTEVYG